FAGLQFGRRSVRSTDESLAEARRALLNEDWERARDLALDVERTTKMAADVAREAEQRREEQNHARTFVAAAQTGDGPRALAAFEHMSSASPYVSRYASRYAELLCDRLA